MDQLGQARERERLRVEDRLKQLDRIEAAATQMVVEGKRRAGYTWDLPVEEARHTMIAAAAAIDDDDLTAAVDQLVGIDIPIQYGMESPVAELDQGFRAVMKELSRVRRAAFADT